MQSYRERNIVKDYVEILIIDRHVKHIYLAYIALLVMPLMMLANNPTKEEITRSTIRKSIPENK
jgi:hypothetical protein